MSMTIRRAFGLMTVLLASLSLANCASGPFHQETVAAEPEGNPIVGGASRAELPTGVQDYRRIGEAKACIAKTRVLKDTLVALGPFFDSTGAQNAVAPGSHGTLLPSGAGNTMFLADAIQKMGGLPVDYNSGNAYRTNGPPVDIFTDPRYANYRVKPPLLMIGSNTSFDIGQSAALDARVAGAGPIGSLGWVQVSLAIALKDYNTSLTTSTGRVVRAIRFNQAGIGAGVVTGATLVTGTAVIQDQGRIQYELVNGMIDLAAIDAVIKRFPIARTHCGHLVADLLSVPEMPLLPLPPIPDVRAQETPTGDRPRV